MTTSAAVDAVAVQQLHEAVMKGRSRSMLG